MPRPRSFLCVLLLLSAAVPALAQDQALEPFLFASSVVAAPAPGQEAELRARSVQLYRIPLSLSLRRAEQQRWGLRLTFPVSLSSHRVEAISDVGRFVEDLGVASVVPGIELELPVGSGLRLRPFGEAGVGKGSEGGDVEAVYAAGLRARFGRAVGRLQLTLGGAALYRKPAAGDVVLTGHASFEAGLDLQAPLGFSLGSREARGGLFAIGRAFDGLELRRAGQDPVTLRRQLEAGVSFATDPALRVWKLKLPWLGISYQFGEVVAGLRIYVAFPF